MSRFGIVPTYWVRSARLSCTDKAVLTALSTYAGEDGFCWPAVSTLATCLGISDRTVQRSLQVLVAEGALQVQSRVGADGRTLSNGYWVRGYGNRVPMEPPGVTRDTGEYDTGVTGPVAPVSPKQYQLEQDQLEQATTPPTRAALIFEHEAHQLAYEQLRRASRNPAAFDASLQAEIAGMTSGKPVAASVVGQMLLELAANGEPFNVARLRGYVRKQREAAESAEAAALPHAYGRRLVPTEAEMAAMVARLEAEEAAAQAARAGGRHA